MLSFRHYRTGILSMLANRESLEDPNRRLQQTASWGRAGAPVASLAMASRPKQKLRTLGAWAGAWASGTGPFLVALSPSVAWVQGLGASGIAWQFGRRGSSSWTQ